MDWFELELLEELLDWFELELLEELLDWFELELATAGCWRAGACAGVMGSGITSNESSTGSGGGGSTEILLTELDSGAT